MPAYYSEFDKNAAAWLRELIKRGLIADGEVDERDLWDVTPNDIRGFTQVHLCAGIGVWSYSLRRAGWPDDRPVWTASFPCQPFSAAGARGGFADERHLWPAGQHLISECRPRTIFGEQVASKDAEPWLDAVQADVEALGYAFGACAFPSAGIGAPHIRDRTYWVADSGRDRLGEHPEQHGRPAQPGQQASLRHDNAGRGEHGRLADDDDARLEGRRQSGRERAAERPAGAGGVAGGVADADGRHAGEERQQRGGEQRQFAQDGGVRGLADTDRRQRQGQPVLRGAERDGQDARRTEGSGGAAARREDLGVRGDGRGLQDGAGAEGEHGLREMALRPGPVNGIWRTADWLYCRDGNWRSVEPGLEPLAHGTPARVGRLRGYGNAINAEAAVAWIESYLEARTDLAAA